MGPPVPHAQPERSVAPARAVLADAFGVSFSVWRHLSEWVCALPTGHQAGMHHSPDGPFVDQLCRCLDANQPLITPLAPSTFRVLVPLSCWDGDRCVAHGIVTTGDGDLLARCAATALMTIRQLRDLETQAEAIDAYAKQVSQDFEELSWLRGLTRQVELMDASTSLKMLAASVLPELRVNLQAEALLLFAPDSQRPEREPGNSSTRDGSPTHDDSSTRYIVETVCGHTTLTAEQLHELVEPLQGHEHARPHVCNTGSDVTSPRVMPPFIRSSVIVDLTRNDRHYGWLVAVNKQVQAEADRSFPPHSSPVEPRNDATTGAPAIGPGEGVRTVGDAGNGEFGTAEASLIETAGVILATAAHNSELLAEQESLLLGTVRALINAIDAKDPYTFGHSERVGQIARRIARQMGLGDEFCRVVYLSGLLHDVGKIGVPDHILQKASKLTDEEFAKIKKHPELGFDILRHVKQLEVALPGVLHHHEAMDGSGYPAGLVGEQIPRIARILAVADSYDAMTSTRSYRPAMSSEVAESILASRAGIQWDPEVVNACLSARADLHKLLQDRDAPPLHVWDVCLSQTRSSSESVRKPHVVTHAADYDFAMENAF
jgi:HD-GYP domain-containing protein (c-di-GMP phosphodiesterase class II)